MAAVLDETHRAVSPAKKTQEQEMDLKMLKEKHPDLVVALSDEIVGGLDMEKLESGNAALVASIREEGASAEVARIADVRAQLVPGHENLIAKMEMDGKSSGADAALAIVAAEQTLRKNAADTLDEEANETVESAEASDDAAKQISREEYDALSITDRRAFVEEGGVVKDK